MKAVHGSDAFSPITMMQFCDGHRKPITIWGRRRAQRKNLKNQKPRVFQKKLYKPEDSEETWSTTSRCEMEIGRRWEGLGWRALKQYVAQNGTFQGPVLGPDEVITIGVCLNH